MPSFNSAVQICNYALNEIGHSSVITDLEEQSTAATRCNLVYDRIRTSLLQSHPWSFVVKTKQLAQSGLTPPNYWEYAYQMPGDGLKILSLYDTVWDRESTRRIDYEINVQTSAGQDYQIIYTDLKDAYARYIIDSENPQVWPQYFVDALYMRIAASICLPMTGDQSMTRDLAARASAMEDLARRQDNEYGVDSTDWYEASAIEARD